jgi:hypothetical protein
MMTPSYSNNDSPRSTRHTFNNVIDRVVGQPLEVGQRQPPNLRNMAQLWVPHAPPIPNKKWQDEKLPSNFSVSIV